MAKSIGYRITVIYLNTVIMSVCITGAELLTAAIRDSTVTFTKI